MALGGRVVVCLQLGGITHLAGIAEITLDWQKALFSEASSFAKFCELRLDSCAPGALHL